MRGCAPCTSLTKQVRGRREAAKATWPPGHLSTYSPTHLPTYPPTHLPISPPTHPPTYLSYHPTYLPITPPTYLSPHLRTANALLILGVWACALYMSLRRFQTYADIVRWWRHLVGVSAVLLSVIGCVTLYLGEAVRVVRGPWVGAWVRVCQLPGLLFLNFIG